MSSHERGFACCILACSCLIAASFSLLPPAWAQEGPHHVGIQAGHWPKAGSRGCGNLPPNDPNYRENYTVNEERDRVVEILEHELDPEDYAIDAIDGDHGTNDVPVGYEAGTFVALHCDHCETSKVLSAGYKAARYGGTKELLGKDGSGDDSDALVARLLARYGTATGLGFDEQPGHYTVGMLNYYGLGNLERSTPGAIIEMGWLFRDYEVISDDKPGGGQDRMARGIANAVLEQLGKEVPDDKLEVYEQTHFTLLDPGEGWYPALFLRNTGGAVWSAQQVYALEAVDNPWDDRTRIELKEKVRPGGIAKLVWGTISSQRPGLSSSTWQMKHQGEAFGPKLRIYAVVVPTEAVELRERLEKLIEEWRQQGKEKVDELVKKLTAELKEYAQSAFERWLHETCGVSVLLVIAPALLLARRRRR
jgi:hypothetical protein